MSAGEQVMPAAAGRGAIRSLVHTWLTLDFFGDSRRYGQPGSSLTTTIFSQSFLGLLFAILTLPDPPYDNAIAWLAANLSLSTLLVGIGTLGDPLRFKRNLADETLVGTAPLRAFTLTLARALHGLFYIGLISIGMALPAAILSYWVCGHSLVAPGRYLILAVLCAGLGAGSLGVLSRFLARWLGTNRALLLGGSLKAILLGGGFVMFVIGLRHMQGTTADLPLGPTSAHIWPPYLAARIVLAPRENLGLLAALVAVAALLYVMATGLQRGGTRRASGRSSRRSLLGWLDHSVAGDGPLLGLTRFVARMLYRSPGFRARVLPLFGLPTAMVLLAFLGQQDDRARRLLLGVTLQFPAVFMPFVVAFMPRSDHENARWLFDTSPWLPAALFRRATLIALSTHILIPAHLLCLAAALTLSTWQPERLAFIIGLSSFSLGAAIVCTANVVRSLRAVPFTVDDDHDEASNALDFGPLLGSGLILVVIGGVYALTLPSWLSLVCGPAVMVAVMLASLRAAPAEATR